MSGGKRKMSLIPLIEILGPIADRLHGRDRQGLIEVLRQQRAMAAQVRLEAGREELKEHVTHGGRGADLRFRDGFLAAMKWLHGEQSQLAGIVHIPVQDAAQLNVLTEELRIADKQARRVMYQVRALEADSLHSLAFDTNDLPLDLENALLRDPMYTEGIACFANGFTADVISGHLPAAGFAPTEDPEEIELAVRDAEDAIHVCRLDHPDALT